VTANLNNGSKTCPIGSECRDFVEGITNGEFKKVALNAGAIGLCSIGNCGVAAKAQGKVGLSSASKGAMVT